MEERELDGEGLRRSFCDICAPGPHCGVLCRVKDGAVVGVEGDPDHPVSQGRLCTRGRAMRQYVYRPDRVLTPCAGWGPGFGGLRAHHLGAGPGGDRRAAEGHPGGERRVQRGLLLGL